MAQALNLIDEPMAQTLHTYREIRNKFAHSEYILDLTKPELEPLLRKLGWTEPDDKYGWWLRNLVKVTTAIHTEA